MTWFMVFKYREKAPTLELVLLVASNTLDTDGTYIKQTRPYSMVTITEKKLSLKNALALARNWASTSLDCGDGGDFRSLKSSKDDRLPSFNSLSMANTLTQVYLLRMARFDIPSLYT